MNLFKVKNLWLWPYTNGLSFSVFLLLFYIRIFSLIFFLQTFIRILYFNRCCTLECLLWCFRRWTNMNLNIIQIWKFLLFQINRVLFLKLINKFISAFYLYCFQIAVYKKIFYNKIFTTDDLLKWLFAKQRHWQLAFIFYFTNNIWIIFSF